MKAFGLPPSMRQEQCSREQGAQAVLCFVVLRRASLRSVAAVQPNAEIHSPSSRLRGRVEVVMLLRFPSRLRPCALLRAAQFCSAGEVRTGPQTEEVKALIQWNRRKRREGTGQMLPLINGPSLVGLAWCVCVCVYVCKTDGGRRS